MTRPRVSVVMPVYNAAPYLGEAVESILTQTFGDLEFLIFDDGSTDGSPAILQDYARRDPRIRLHLGAHNGLVKWLNRGIEQARGEFLARMDADDIAEPSRLAEQLSFLEAHPDHLAVGSAVLLIDPDGAPLCKVPFDEEHDAIDRYAIEGGLGAICHPAAMFRRSALVEVGGYTEQYENLLEDVDLFLRLAELGRLANLPTVLLRYRVHHRSVCAQRWEHQIELARRLLAEARSRRGLPPADVQALPGADSDAERHRRWALLAAGGGHGRTALKNAGRGIRLAPFEPRSWYVLARSLAPNWAVNGIKRLGITPVVAAAGSSTPAKSRVRHGA